MPYEMTVLAAIAAVFLGLAANAGAEEQPASSEALAAEARGISTKFAEKLKSELVGAIKVDGPLKAIEVCQIAAPAIAADSSANGWSVGRTSLKTRNQKNVPDAWEKRLLDEFDAAKSKGADATKLERFEIVEKNGVRTFRYMKAIPAAEPCLTCHGEAIKEPVKAKLAELYPDDHATGYKEGDIRGAFTLSKALQ
jgi:hypothetical protein